MTNPISGGTAFDFGAAAQTAPAQPETVTAPLASARRPAGVEPVTDTVKISAGARVRLLKTQGQTLAEIAFNTALSAEAVNSYLGIAPAPLPPVAAAKK
jgi:hypothetical protein